MGGALVILFNMQNLQDTTPAGSLIIVTVSGAGILNAPTVTAGVG